MLARDELEMDFEEQLINNMNDSVEKRCASNLCSTDVSKVYFERADEVQKLADLIKGKAREG